MALISLIFRGGLALFREGGGRVARGVACFERRWGLRSAAFPAALIEGGALLARGLVKAGGEGLFAVAAFLLLVLLFVLLR